MYGASAPSPDHARARRRTGHRPRRSTRRGAPRSAPTSSIRLRMPLERRGSALCRHRHRASPGPRDRRHRRPRTGPSPRAGSDSFHDLVGRDGSSRRSPPTSPTPAARRLRGLRAWSPKPVDRAMILPSRNVETMPTLALDLDAAPCAQRPRMTMSEPRPDRQRHRSLVHRARRALVPGLVSDSDELGARPSWPRIRVVVRPSTLRISTSTPDPGTQRRHRVAVG